MLSRRSLLTGSLALVFTPPTAVWAQNQAEWSQNYEAVSRDARPAHDDADPVRRRRWPPPSR